MYILSRMFYDLAEIGVLHSKRSNCWGGEELLPTFIAQVQRVKCLTLNKEPQFVDNGLLKPDPVGVHFGTLVEKYGLKIPVSCDGPSLDDDQGWVNIDRARYYVHTDGPNRPDIVDYHKRYKDDESRHMSLCLPLSVRLVVSPGGAR